MLILLEELEKWKCLACQPNILETNVLGVKKFISLRGVTGSSVRDTVRCFARNTMRKDDSNFSFTKFKTLKKLMEEKHVQMFYHPVRRLPMEVTVLSHTCSVSLLNHSLTRSSNAINWKSKPLFPLSCVGSSMSAMIITGVQLKHRDYEHLILLLSLQHCKYEEENIHHSLNFKILDIVVSAKLLTATIITKKSHITSCLARIFDMFGSLRNCKIATTSTTHRSAWLKIAKRKIYVFPVHSTLMEHVSA